MYVKKIMCLMLTLILAIIPLSACSSDENTKYAETRIVMDTPATLKAYGKNAKKAVQESFQRLDELDKMASPSISGSDVSKINAASGNSYVKVHAEIIKMIQTSIKYSKLSNGAFDITMGPLINLWGIGTDNAKLPSDAEIKAKLPLIGYDKISINEKGSSVMLEKSGMAIDLGGIAKGFAADEVLKIYKKYNINNGLINLGSSSIYAIGKNEESKPWSIGIKHPRSDEGQNFLGVIGISDEALSTSGDYERFFIKNGKRYHHILNPATGAPADTGVMSDTIIVDGDSTDRNMLADLLTTAVFVLGPEKGLKFAESLPGVTCEITTSDFKIYESSGFKGKFSNLNRDFTTAN